MQYAVQLTVTTFSTKANDNRKPWTRFTIVPAFSKSDAQDIVQGFKRSTVNHHQTEPDYAHERAAQVVGMVRTAKGWVYLDLDTLQEIAEDYTAPHSLAAE